MILLRTQAVTEEVRRLVEGLQHWSALPVTYLIDERGGSVDTGRRAKISITHDACSAVGLFCPEDFAWRCGDYGFYLARQRYPNVKHFWMIEEDVRLVGRDPSAFFRKFEPIEADLLSSYIETPDVDWPWMSTITAENARPAKCFFPVVRLSSPAIDILLAKRRVHSKHWARRRLWANDEAFVATTLLAAERTMLDLNEGEPKVYRPEHYYFDTLLDGEAPIESDAEVELFHSVLSGAALERKRERLAGWTTRRSIVERLRAKLSGHLSLDALAHAINKRSSW